MPVLITIALIILPFSITGLIIAPEPVPESLTITSGIELYSDPWLTTAALSTLPLTTIGLISAFLPFWILISGLTCWSNIVEP